MPLTVQLILPFNTLFRLAESSRIKAAGGYVEAGRVNGAELSGHRNINAITDFVAYRKFGTI
jgi:predicted NAD/FAD-dependent oxidoreductase